MIRHKGVVIIIVFHMAPSLEGNVVRMYLLSLYDTDWTDCHICLGGGGAPFHLGIDPPRRCATNSPL